MAKRSGGGQREGIGSKLRVSTPDHTAPPVSSFALATLSGTGRDTNENAPEIALRGAFVSAGGGDQWITPWARTAKSSRATMLVILIIGFTAGPEVSL